MIRIVNCWISEHFSTSQKVITSQSSSARVFLKLYIIYNMNGSTPSATPHQHSMWHADGGRLTLWRRTCSPLGPTPQRQCAWLLSTYFKEGEEQKEVLEAKDGEEKEIEIDGEVEESHSTCS